MRRIRLAICHSGRCPMCDKNWEGLIGPCTCGYGGPMIQDE